MSPIINFDSSRYVRPPPIDVRSGVALAIALLNAVPKTPPPGVLRTAQRLQKATVELKSKWAARDRAATKPEDPKRKPKADNRSDTGWRNLERRLVAYSELPADIYPGAIIAQRLVRILFANGLSFLTLPMPQQWAEGQKILDRIDAENLAADIDKYAGPDFLAEVRAAQTVYGEVLGITKPKAPTEAADPLLDPLRALGKAIGDYTLQVAAMVDDEDPATLEIARAALLPVDEYREAVARRASKSGDASADDLPGVDPSTPVPEVPATPA